MSFGKFNARSRHAQKRFDQALMLLLMCNAILFVLSIVLIGVFL